MKTLGLSTTINPVDIGVRVEVPASILRSITDVVHEAKFMYNSKMFDDPVRTFCMNPYGVVVKEKYKGFCTVNGHSFSTKSPITRTSRYSSQPPLPSLSKSR